jgi:hypothetical protein
VFQLLFEPRHNVLMTRYFGIYVQNDITLRDNAVARFVDQRGLARGIMDFSDVEAVEVTIDSLVKRAHEPPKLPGQDRVIVAPGGLTYELNRVVIAHQLYSRKVEPLLVRTLGEAYRALSLNDPKFEPLAQDEAAILDATMLRVLDEIDEAQGAGVGDDERQRMRATFLRLMDSLPAGHAARQRPIRQANVITVSDILNTALSRAKLTDADLMAACGTCRRPVSLGACEVAAGQQTSYACPKCGSVLVVLASVGEGVTPPPGRGYRLGTFMVRNTVDIECRGATLPKPDGPEARPD